MQDENGRLRKQLDLVHAKQNVSLPEVQKERERFKKTLEEVKSDVVCMTEYLDLVKELCKIREAKAYLVMEKQRMQLIVNEEEHTDAARI